MAVNNVAINDIMKIIKDTNPKDAVDKIIEETRSLIAEITKQMSEAKLTEKNKLRKVLEKLDALKSGGGDFNGKLEDVLQNLNLGFFTIYFVIYPISLKMEFSSLHYNLQRYISNSAK